MITVTETAKKQLDEILMDEPNGKYVRAFISGGGCSGFQYKYDFVTEENLDDIILRKGGVTVLIDAISAQFMQDAVIDYVETLGSSELLINNPNAASRCGCGNSFSI